MEFITKAYRSGDIILSEESHAAIFEEIKAVIGGISDADIWKRHEERYSKKMSLSYAINDLLRNRFVEKGWLKEAPIFSR